MARAQTLIPGTVDEAPAVVKRAAAKYLEHKRAVAAGREKMHSARDELIEKMKENDCFEMLIDDGEKRLILSETDTIKIEARKKKDDPR